MNQAYDIEIVNEAFCPARDQFEAMIRELHSDPEAQMEHDHLEALIKKQGAEVMRLVIQGHLHVRSKHEQRMESVQGADGILRTHCRENCERNLMLSLSAIFQDGRYQGFEVTSFCVLVDERVVRMHASYSWTERYRSHRWRLQSGMSIPARSGRACGGGQIPPRGCRARRA